MALEQKLSLKLAQKLVMTPSLQQAIKLLQMPKLELEGVLTKELIENPVLEENEQAPAEEERAAQDDAKEGDSLSDIDLEAYFSDYAESWEGRGSQPLFEERQAPPLENTLSRDPDLYDHLLWQLHMMDVEPEQREIAELIIGNLNPEGFLVATVEEIMAMGAEPSDFAGMAFESAGATDADGDGNGPRPGPAVTAGAAEVAANEAGADEAEVDEAGEDEVDAVEEAAAPGHLDAVAIADDGRGYSREAVEKALALVRGLDPPGIACPTLRESLLFQLDARGESHGSLVRQVITDHWEPFKHRKFEAVAKALGVPLHDLEPVVETVRTLDTRPGRKFSADRTHYVEPDVYVIKVGDEYLIELNDDGLPRLRVSRAYRKLLQVLRHAGDQADAQQYLKDKMRSAMWLIKSLDQRQRTIYKVASSIVRQQRAFLDYGIEHLRPMVLRDVAEDIDMHESTVSRVVSNKYIHTPRGLYPMKFFFHSGIDREYGEDISSLTVKRKIQQLIQDENSRKPLSDSELMRILNREGIHIARRTVAKYRDELGIPSSTERKQIF